MSFYEVIAVLFSLAYLFYTAKLNALGWSAAFISAALYSVIFFDVQLWISSLLNIFYLCMAMYGFYQWKINVKIKDKPLQCMTYSHHVLMLIGTTSIGLLLGYVLQNYTNSSMAYMDSVLSCFSILATFMLIYKIVESWLYWFVIDAASLYLYVEKQLWATCFLFCIYIILAIRNYMLWHRQFYQER